MLALSFLPVGQGLGATETAPATGPGLSPSGSTEIDAEIAAARSQIAADPAKAEHQVRLGWLLLKRGSLDEALKWFDEALRRTPRSIEARTGKGIALSRKGELGEAEQALLEALALNPRPARARYELGLVYQKQGESAKALVQFREGIRVAQ